MDTLTKLGILAEAAKYDAACTSSGVSRGPERGKLGMASQAGCCHSFTADGRCITLLKVLMSNACSYDCAYCVNRRSNSSCPRATFTPRELAELTVDFYKRNYIEGLFLSSGVLGDPDATTERMISCLTILRDELQFNGYIHAKTIPGTSPELIEQLGRLADRLSVNIELPSAASLERLCPDKQATDCLRPMAQIAESISAGRRALGAGRAGARGRSDIDERATGLARVEPAAATQTLAKRRPFAPAGQSTQLIVGASAESDYHILELSRSLYAHYQLKRVFFSAYIPLMDDAALPALETPVPLRREHRLYQADWLMRYYQFSPAELVTSEEPWLDLDVDPKLAWALRNIERFPLEVNDASLEDLLRVPGIGPTGARKIIRARRNHALTFDDLTRLKIVLKRARHFLLCNGKRDPASPLDPTLIRHKVVEDAKSSHYNQHQRARDAQLSLF